MSIIRTIFTAIIAAFSGVGLLIALGFFLAGLLFAQGWAFLVAFLVFMPTLLPLGILTLLLRTGPRPIHGRVPRVKGNGTIRRTREWVKETIPAREPARAAILGVLDEAAQLKFLMARLDSASFREVDASIGAMPTEFTSRVDQSVEAASSLAERIHILYPTKERRPLDIRTREALDRQVIQMQNLQIALSNSRSMLEIVALNHTAVAGDTTRLVRSLTHLTEAIGEVQGVSRVSTQVFAAPDIADPVISAPRAASAPIPGAQSRTPEAADYLRTVF